MATTTPPVRPTTQAAPQPPPGQPPPGQAPPAQAGQPQRVYYYAPTNNWTSHHETEGQVYYVSGPVAYDPISQTFCVHIAIACMTFWMCGIIFGLIAFILAGLI